MAGSPAASNRGAPPPAVTPVRHPSTSNTALPPVLGGLLPRTNALGFPINRSNTNVTPLSSKETLTPLDNEQEDNLRRIMADDASYLEAHDRSKRRMTDVVGLYGAVARSAKRMRLSESRTVEAQRAAGQATLPSLQWWEINLDSAPPEGLSPPPHSVNIIYPQQRRNVTLEKATGQVNRLLLPPGLTTRLPGPDQNFATTTGRRGRPRTNAAAAAAAAQAARDATPIPTSSMTPPGPGSKPALLDAASAPSSRLAEDLVPIRLELEADPLRLVDTFTWNVHEPLSSTEPFAQMLCDDLGLPSSIFVSAIREAMDRQLAQHALLSSSSLVSLSPRPDLTLSHPHPPFKTEPSDALRKDLAWWAKVRDQLALLDPRPDEDTSTVGARLVPLDEEEEASAELNDEEPGVSTKWANADLRISIKVRCSSMNLQLPTRTKC